MQEGVKWDYFKKFTKINDKYLPDVGEGDTQANQIVTAINKLVYKWYNDGDVYDNTHFLPGWANDLSSYANWLYNNVFETKFILPRIEEAMTDGQYELILKELADKCLNEKFLKPYSKKENAGSIYECEGKFKFEDVPEEDFNDNFEEDDEEM